MDEKPQTLYQFCAAILLASTPFRLYLAFWCMYLQVQTARHEF